MHNLWTTYWILFGLLASLLISILVLGVLLSFTRRSALQQYPFTEKGYYDEGFKTWIWHIPNKVYLTPEAADLALHDVALEDMQEGIDYRYDSTWRDLPISSKVLYVLLSIFWPFTICVAISLYTIYHVVRVLFTLGKRAGSTLDKVMR